MSRLLNSTLLFFPIILEISLYFLEVHAAINIMISQNVIIEDFNAIQPNDRKSIWMMPNSSNIALQRIF